MLDNDRYVVLPANQQVLTPRTRPSDSSARATSVAPYRAPSDQRVQNGTSSSRSQLSDSSVEDSAGASSPAPSNAATSSPIACRSAGSKSETRSPYGAPPDVKPTAQISSPPQSTQPLSAKRCASVRSTSSSSWRRPRFRDPRRRPERAGDPDDLRAAPFRFATVPILTGRRDAKSVHVEGARTTSGGRRPAGLHSRKLGRGGGTREFGSPPYAC